MSVLVPALVLEEDECVTLSFTRSGARGAGCADGIRVEGELLAHAEGRGDPVYLFDVAESLLDHDEAFALWRSRHVLMVERQIGGKTGTGGSSGAQYLRTTLGKRFYPELWDVRSQL